MNIKSILHGSAAALVAVSGARAADAVVMVEPEPVEYVRVCDVYGAGFFYIPGTETCLKIGGYVRMRIEANDSASPFATDLDSSGDYNMATRVRARLNFDAREETELGTLRAYARVQATNTSGTSEAYIMDAAFIQLGGLTIGKLDSLWAERDGLYTDSDWSVGDFNNNRISYTYTANGFSAALSVEDDGDGDFAPDVVGQLAYEGAWGSAYISGVYDEDSSTTLFTAAAPAALAFIDPITGLLVPAVDAAAFINGVDGGDSSDGAFALKAGIELKNLIAADSAFKIEGSYAFDPTVYNTNSYLTEGRNTDYAGTDIANFAGNVIPVEWQIGAGYQQKFGKFTGYVSGVYGETFDFTTNGVNYDNGEFYGAAVNLGYQITTNFSVLGEVAYRNVDTNSANDFDQTTGFLEFMRTF